MKDPVTRTLLKTRDKALSTVTTGLKQIQDEIELLRNDLKQDIKSVNETQLTINHNQSAALDEINRRTKNSGAVVLSEALLITKIFSGLKMYLDPRDIAVVPHLVLDSIWEHRVTTAWLAAVRTHDTVLDIGANFGYYGALAAQISDKKHSKVVLFEANPKLIPYIQKTLDVNWLNEQTSIVTAAVADKPGELTLYVLKDYIGSSSVHEPAQVDSYMHGKMHVESQEEIRVPAITVDDYCKEAGIQAVDLIKMDIEGFEYEAYQGMRETVRASKEATLFIEFTRQAYKDPEGFYNQLLEDFKYVYCIDDDGYIVKPKKTTYDFIIGDADDWVMPIFSKRSNLANK